MQREIENIQLVPGHGDPGSNDNLNSLKRMDNGDKVKNIPATGQLQFAEGKGHIVINTITDNN